MALSFPICKMGGGRGLRLNRSHLLRSRHRERLGRARGVSRENTCEKNGTGPRRGWDSADPKASLTLCGCCRPQRGPLSERLTEQKRFASWTWKLHFRESDAAGLAGSFRGLSPWLTDGHLLPGSSRGLRSVWLKS